MLQALENESFDTCYAPLFQYWKALATKRVEGMLDFSPAQELTAFMCSSR